MKPKLELLHSGIVCAVALVMGSSFRLVGAEPPFSDADWTALGSGLGNAVTALAMSGSGVFAGGMFTTAGGRAANRIAKWNGSSWSAVGAGVNSSVWALAVSGSVLQEGGGVAAGGGGAASYSAIWNG